MVIAFAQDAVAQDAVAQYTFSEYQVVQAYIEEFPVHHPFFAQKYLRDDMYSAWCLLHNKAEYTRAADAREPGRLTTVSDIRVDIYGDGLTVHPGYGTVNYGNTSFNRKTIVRTYESGGRSGGPITIYNPYVVPG